MRSYRFTSILAAMLLVAVAGCSEGSNPLSPENFVRTSGFTLMGQEEPDEDVNDVDDGDVNDGDVDDVDDGAVDDVDDEDVDDVDDGDVDDGDVDDGDVDDLED